MELYKKLSKIIFSLEGESKSLILAICGAADLGKTYLAKNLMDYLNKIGKSANHITLDSYLMPRDKRIQLGVSGYEFEAYDFVGIQNDLVRFIRGLPIVIFSNTPKIPKV